MGVPEGAEKCRKCTKYLPLFPGTKPVFAGVLHDAGGPRNWTGKVSHGLLRMVMPRKSNIQCVPRAKIAISSRLLGFRALRGSNKNPQGFLRFPAGFILHVLDSLGCLGRDPSSNDALCQVSVLQRGNSLSLCICVSVCIIQKVSVIY